MQVTAAHEYNHVLQYAYDAFQDAWMFEATATWAEEKVFDDVDDYVCYIDSWAARPDVPITSAGDGAAPSTDELKMYGSAIWNHWLDDALRAAGRAPRVERSRSPTRSRAAASRRTPTTRRSATPCGPGFAYEIGEFSAATAEWDAADSGIRGGRDVPDARSTRRGTLAPDGATRHPARVDHTAFALFDVPVRRRRRAAAPDRRAARRRRAGASRSSADRRHEPEACSASSTPTAGSPSRSPDPGQFSRITAVVANTDTSASGYEHAAGRDWRWTPTRGSPESAGRSRLAARRTGVTPCPREPTRTRADATASPTATATPTVTPTPTPAPRTSVTLTRSSTKLATIARTGVLAFFARTNKAGRLTAKATVDRATACG